MTPSLILAALNCAWRGRSVVVVDRKWPAYRPPAAEVTSVVHGLGSVTESLASSLQAQGGSNEYNRTS
jgi:hypothetical protein